MTFDTSFKSEWQRATLELAERANVIEVAQRLEMSLIGPRSGNPRALCPFHEDKTPSLTLYNDHYHCFACGAHGNVFELVKTVRGIPFGEARDWLAAQFNFQLPQAIRRGKSSPTPRELGLALAFDQFKDQTELDRNVLRNWAKQRGFQEDFLNKAEVFGAKGNKLSRFFGASQDWEAVDSLVEAGLIYQPKANLDLNFGPQDFFRSDRIIFPIRSSQNHLVGFSGRAVGSDEPKYLFSKGLPKGKVLYRLNFVREKLLSGRTAKEIETCHIYLVEGLVDSLRFESLGFNSVAILGSRITKDQSLLLSELAEDLDKMNRQLVVHIFLDSDEAGEKGTAASIPMLWEASRDSNPNFFLDVIFPKSGKKGSPHDPDEYFRSLSLEHDTKTFLEASSVSSLAFLMAYILCCRPEDLEPKWNSLSQTDRLACLRRIERLADSASWSFYFKRLFPENVFLGNRRAENQEWLIVTKAYLLSQPLAQVESEQPHRWARVGDSEKERFSLALKLATSSAQRKDIPADDGSWIRINLAGDIFEEHFRKMLEVGAWHEEPFVAAKIPKKHGEYRLKALPCHEDLILQQYLLNGILGDYPNNSRFMNLIPATRFSRFRQVSRSRTTGLPEQIPVLPEGLDGIISFAYQVDMDVVEGLIPPGNTGMFRPYAECWQEFISYLDSRVSGFKVRDLHVIRLDIRKYYDQLPFFAVRDVLLPALEQALTLLKPSLCAPCFHPNEEDPKERAKKIVDWFFKVSFGYKYFDPSDGHTQEYLWKDRGIPQGPDLSAYLATIALFPLDRKVTQRVEELNRGGNCRAVYARYVDDLILISDSNSILSEIRLDIEKELAKIGLELNKKSAPLPVMSQADVREWLTDERGGLGVSSPSSCPTADFESLVNDCIETGHVDRHHSLLLLHNLRLADPNTSRDDVLDGVKTARQNPELRFGDLCCAAKHIWRSLSESETEPSFDRYVIAFFDHWKKLTPIKVLPDEERNFERVTAILAGLDGLERFLTSRADRNPAFSKDAHEKHELRRKKLAMAVVAGSLKSLTNPGGDDSARLKDLGISHQLNLKWLAVKRIAFFLVENPRQEKSNFNDNLTVEITPPILRHLCSFATSCQDNSILDRAQMKSPDSSAPVLLLHNAIARLQIGEMFKPADPLQGLEELSRNVLDKKGFFPNLTVLIEALTFWLPSTTKMMNGNDSLKAALRTFVNIAPKSMVAEYLTRRPTFSNELLSGAEPLPVPPGIEYPGILGWNEKEKTIVHLDLAQNTLFQAPPEMRWEKKSEDGGTWCSFHAPALGWEPLWRHIPSAMDLCKNPNFPSFIANLFLELHKESQRKDGNLPQCSAPFIFVKNFQREKLTFDAVSLIGYQIPTIHFETSAFIRRGNSLVQEGINQSYSEVWRLGTALADLTGFLDHSHCDSNIRLTAKSFICQDGNHFDWVMETLVRIAFYRLRGRKLRPGSLREDFNSKLPLPAFRAVNQLRNFPAQTQIGPELYVHIKYLLASLAEARAMSLIMANKPVPEGPGGATAFLLKLASHFFRDDEIMESHLPPIPDSDSCSYPKRRSVLGYFNVARRIFSLIPKEKLDADLFGLQALSAGLWILAMTENMKAQVLERLHILNSEDLESLKETLESKTPKSQTLGLEKFGIESQTCLLEGNFEDQQVELVRRLLDWKKGETFSPEKIGEVTPLGWWALLLVFCGFGETLFKKTIGFGSKLAPQKKEELGASFEKITGALLLWDQGTRDFPWDGISTACHVWTESFSLNVFSNLADLDQHFGFEIEQNHDSLFAFVPNYRRGTVELTLPTGRFTLKLWRFLFSTIAGNYREVESIVPQGIGEKKVSVWSETHCGGDLLAISAMSFPLAKLAGVRASKAAPIQTIQTSTTVSEVSRPPESDNSLLPIETGPTASTTGCQNSPESSSVQEPDKIGIESVAQELDSIFKMQRSSWGSRQEETRDVANHVRIALLQIDLDCTYLHPVSELCDKNNLDEFDGSEIKRASSGFRNDFTKWTSDVADKLIGKTKSCSELRRQRILSVVLRACGAFKVDILVLPEYSVRPETVDWIARKLPELAPSTAVWAGTFRKPPYYSGPCAETFKDVPDWAAPLSVVLPGNGAGGSITASRWKKYPAASLGEIFYPFRGVIEPISNQLVGKGGYKTFLKLVCELVCSEVFLISSPSNLLSLGVRLRALKHKFGLPGSDSLKDAWEQEVLADCKSFSNFTSLQTSRNNERHPIVIVPALTPRPVDWAVAGQAGFLASGLTTVFCNGVHNPNGKGQSCFIGTDCWDNNQRHSGSGPRLPQLEPYHGVRPGIYDQGQKDRGWLGIDEQAMVIADIDPILSFGGKPAPESLGSSLTLVAHLPIIESDKYTKSSSKNIDCRCSSVSSRIRGDFQKMVSELVQRLDEIRECAKRTGKEPASISDEHPEILVGLLKKLAKLADSKENPNSWLNQRADAYLNHHAGDPAPWPPPVALDWLWVDVDYQSSDIPIIAMPEYSKAPGESLK